MGENVYLLYNDKILHSYFLSLGIPSHFQQQFLSQKKQKSFFHSWKQYRYIHKRRSGSLSCWQILEDKKNGGESGI